MELVRAGGANVASGDVELGKTCSAIDNILKFESRKGGTFFDWELEDWESKRAKFMRRIQWNSTMKWRNLPNPIGKMVAGVAAYGKLKKCKTVI